jgi:hypothetical protein
MNKTYYLHAKTKRGRHFTLAAKEKGSELVIGHALCSAKDQFCKRKGRAMAEGRINAVLSGKHKDGTYINSRTQKVLDYNFVDTAKIKVNSLFTLRDYAQDFAELN